MQGIQIVYSTSLFTFISCLIIVVVGLKSNLCWAQPVSNSNITIYFIVNIIPLYQFLQVLHLL